MTMLELFKALADPTRLRLINIIRQGEFTVQEIVAVLGMGQSRVSRHLKILLDVGLFEVKRQGTWAYYRLANRPSLFARLWPQLEEQFAQLPDAAADQDNIILVLAARRERSRQFFAQHARDWDRLSRQLLPTPDYFDPLVNGLPDAGCLVEIGVGTGPLLERLSQLAQQVIGIDQSPGMIEAARQRITLADLDNVELRLGEMEHLPLDTASVDAALLNMVLHHAPDPQSVLSEIQRVLRPGGLLSIADLVRHRQEWVRDKVADQWLGFTAVELRNWAEKSHLRVEEIVTLPGDKKEFSVMLTRLRKP